MKAIFLHCYYGDIVDEMLLKISNVTFDFNLYVNIVDGPDSKTILKKVIGSFPKAFIIISDNKGHDIGGQLVLMDHWLNTDMIEDEIIFLQTKKSPQHIEGGTEWRNELMRILLPEFNEMLIEDDNIGMVGSKRWLINDKMQCYHYLQPELNELCGMCGMSNIKKEHFGFIGGTMFIVKAGIYADFFIKNPPLKIRELMTSVAYAHAMERVLGFIVLDAGYEIVGI